MKLKIYGNTIAVNFFFIIVETEFVAEQKQNQHFEIFMLIEKFDE